MHVLTLRFFLGFTEGSAPSLVFRNPRCSAHAAAGSGRLAPSGAGPLLGTGASRTVATGRAGSAPVLRQTRLPPAPFHTDMETWNQAGAQF